MNRRISSCAANGLFGGPAAMATQVKVPEVLLGLLGIFPGLIRNVNYPPFARRKCSSFIVRDECNNSALVVGAAMLFSSNQS